MERDIRFIPQTMGQLMREISSDSPPHFQFIERVLEFHARWQEQGQGPKAGELWGSPFRIPSEERLKEVFNFSSVDPRLAFFEKEKLERVEQLDEEVFLSLLVQPGMGHECYTETILTLLEEEPIRFEQDARHLDAVTEKDALPSLHSCTEPQSSTEENHTKDGDDLSFLKPLQEAIEGQFRSMTILKDYFHKLSTTIKEHQEEILNLKREKESLIDTYEKQCKEKEEQIQYQASELAKKAERLALQEMELEAKRKELLSLKTNRSLSITAASDVVNTMQHILKLLGGDSAANSSSEEKEGIEP